MRKICRAAVLVGGASLSGIAQTHRVVKPETVVRAVGVYEWTGDLAKPHASRLIPITLFIDQHLEDAGLYLARPVPFALESGDIYQLEQAGVAKGNVELVYARHLQASALADTYDNGWFGYGSFKPLPTPKKPIAPKASAQLSKVESSGGDTRKPHFSSKGGEASAGTESGGATKSDEAKPTDTKVADADPDRPTMKRRNTESTSATDEKSPAASSAPADDPDRPTMKRKPETTSDANATDSRPTAGDDPDRPTLKRHTAEDAKKAAKVKMEASVTGASGSLNDDPDRPNLHRGKPTGAMTEADLPKLAGLPEDLHQVVAVSDAANRPVHEFARAWEDEAERIAVLAKMQAMARAQLAAYAVSATGKQQPATATRKPDSKRRRPVSVQVGSAQLLDEQMNGYLLSYGDVPTFVYQAHTAGTGSELRYVTIVAQRNAQGDPVMAMHTVTDAAHLDRTARMRLVDAVDVEASNRASLLFELRGQTSRQFSVYRVLGQHAEEIFNTGTMQ